MKLKITITLDTTYLDRKNLDQIETAAAFIGAEIAGTTVSEREFEGTDNRVPKTPLVETVVWGESVWGKAVWGGPLPETLVIGESRIGKAVIGDSGERFEYILKLISNGSFPKLGNRDNLTRGQRHQLRDAMIFDTHVRERRDIFITGDGRAFIAKDESIRNELQKVFKTRIMTLEEFKKYAVAQTEFI